MAEAESCLMGAFALAQPCPTSTFLARGVVGVEAQDTPCRPGAQVTGAPSLPGVAVSTYAKYCYHKLQKAALTGAKKVRVLTGRTNSGGGGRGRAASPGEPGHLS